MNVDKPFFFSLLFFLITCLYIQFFVLLNSYFHTTNWVYTRKGEDDKLPLTGVWSWIGPRGKKETIVSSFLCALLHRTDKVDYDQKRKKGSIGSERGVGKLSVFWTAGGSGSDRGGYALELH